MAIKMKQSRIEVRHDASENFMYLLRYKPTIQIAGRVNQHNRNGHTARKLIYGGVFLCIFTYAGSCTAQQGQDEYFETMQEYAEVWQYAQCDEPILKTRFGVYRELLDCLLQVGGEIEPIQFDSGLYRNAFGPQCVESEIKSTRVCLKRGEVEKVKIVVEKKEGIGGDPYYSVSKDDDRCIDISVRLSADHYGNYPNYHCLTGASIYGSVIVLPKH